MSTAVRRSLYTGGRQLLILTWNVKLNQTLSNGIKDHSRETA